MLRHLREYAKIRCFFLYSILAVNRPFVHFLFCSIPAYSPVLVLRYNRVLLEIKPSFSPLAVIRSICVVFTLHTLTTLLFLDTQVIEVLLFLVHMKRNML